MSSAPPVPPLLKLHGCHWSVGNCTANATVGRHSAAAWSCVVTPSRRNGTTTIRPSTLTEADHSRISPLSNIRSASPYVCATSNFGLLPLERPLLRNVAVGYRGGTCCRVWRNGRSIGGTPSLHVIDVAPRVGAVVLKPVGQYVNRRGRDAASVNLDPAAVSVA